MRQAPDSQRLASERLSQHAPVFCAARRAFGHLSQHAPVFTPVGPELRTQLADNQSCLPALKCRSWHCFMTPMLSQHAPVSPGTHHNIFSIANVLTELGYKILNVITWAKTNPPPNISCRFFTYSTEFIIWARKCPKVPHKYNYELMKAINDGKQMTDVWRLPAIARWEKSCGKHPTQKPLALLIRIILASTDEHDWILDPFAGSSTTGIAANLCGRRFLGVEQELKFVSLSKTRREELDNLVVKDNYIARLSDLSFQLMSNTVNEPEGEYLSELPF